MTGKAQYTVVVADDEDELREAVCTMTPWQEFGFRLVGSASNGLDALQLVEKHQPDLLLTDIRMPFISGIELARQVREIRPATNIAFLSGYDDFQYAKQAIQYNIISYMLKPLTVEGLAAELKMIREKIDTQFAQFRQTPAGGGELDQRAALLMPLVLDDYADPEEAARAAEPYLTSADVGAKLSACLLSAYANLSLGRIQRARFALGELNTALSAVGEQTPELRAAPAFVATAGAVLLHLPLPEELPEMESFLPLLPPGLRAFALYVQAHYLYLRGEYSKSAGVVEATLAMGAGDYLIPAIYLHLVAVMDYMSLKQTDRAQAHLLTAWEAARPDDLLEAFGEHHGLLGAMLEAVIKPNWPEDFRRVIDITYRFSSGWRRVHNPMTGDDVADDLTTTEFAIAMLAARGWTTREIAEHLNISVNTAKRHISEAMKNLNAANRKELKRYLLQ